MTLFYENSIVMRSLCNIKCLEYGKNLFDFDIFLDRASLLQEWDSLPLWSVLPQIKIWQHKNWFQIQTCILYGYLIITGGNMVLCKGNMSRYARLKLWVHYTRKWELIISVNWMIFACLPETSTSS